MGMGIARLVTWNGNGNGLMGMGGTENSTFFICHPHVADHQILLMDSLFFCIATCRRLLG